MVKNEQMNNLSVPKHIWTKHLKQILLIICIISVINVVIDLRSLLCLVVHGIIIADNVHLSGVFWTKSCLFLAHPIMSLYNASCLIPQKIRKWNFILWSHTWNMFLYFFCLSSFLISYQWAWRKNQNYKSAKDSR